LTQGRTDGHDIKTNNYYVTGCAELLKLIHSSASHWQLQCINTAQSQLGNPSWR